VSAKKNLRIRERFILLLFGIFAALVVVELSMRLAGFILSRGYEDAAVAT